MDLFLFALALGGVGLVAMAVLGLGAHGHAHGGAARGGGGVLRGGGMRGGGVRGAGHAHGRLAVHGGGSPAMQAIVNLASPRVLLSVCFGFGVAGVLARLFVREAWAIPIALAGGVLFELLLVAPLWRWLFRFASNPAQTLEHALFTRAEAVTAFDHDGNGLVRVEVDGQVVQMLASLRPEDRGTGTRVRAGDELMVDDVDEARQRCRVSTR